MLWNSDAWERETVCLLVTFTLQHFAHVHLTEIFTENQFNKKCKISFFCYKWDETHFRWIFAEWVETSILIINEISWDMMVTLLVQNACQVTHSLHILVEWFGKFMRYLLETIQKENCEEIFFLALFSS